MLKEEMSIIIGADIVQTPSNYREFADGNIEALIGKELYSVLMKADINIFNLEGPLLNTGEKLQKAGSPNLKSTEESINTLKRIPNLFISGANNHILDYKEEGICSTVNLLSKNKIDYVGFGTSEERIMAPLFVRKKGHCIGVYSLAENEFSTNHIKGMGANGFDALTSLDMLETVKKKCDFLIVLFHAGRENYKYPSPGLKRVCEKMVDKGADIVICQHSHCIGCKELYNGKTIIYGQGNTLFDIEGGASGLEDWHVDRDFF